LEKGNMTTKNIHRQSMILRSEMERLKRLGRYSPIEAARMALALKGVTNHWTLTYRDGPDGFKVLRNPNHPGIVPLP
jgi:hypothetical protein